MVWVRRADLTASYAIDLHTCLRFEWCNYLSMDEVLMHPSDALQRCYRSPDGKWIREWPTSELESAESLDLPHPRISYEYFECHPIHIARDIFAKYRAIRRIRGKRAQVMAEVIPMVLSGTSKSNNSEGGGVLGAGTGASGPAPNGPPCTQSLASACDTRALRALNPDEPAISWQDEEEPLPVSSWYLPPELEEYRAIASDEDLYRDWLDKSKWPDPLLPRWDLASQELVVAGSVCRRFTKIQNNYQVAILQALDDAGWPDWINDPLANWDRLMETVKSFNKMSNGLFKLRFTTHPTNRVGWTITGPGPHLP